jgi:hypothetical protein
MVPEVLQTNTMKNNSGRKQKSIGSTILILIVAVAYMALKPKVEKWLENRNGGKVDSGLVQNTDGKASGPVNLDRLKQIDLPTVGGTQPPTSGTNPVQKSPTSNRQSQTTNTAKVDSAEVSSSTNVLTKVGRAYHSKAGLIYGPGKEHRRDHVLRHARDDLSKPAHGVFDDEASVFALVDEAYEKVKKNSRDVKSTKERDRMAHVVKMGRRIGFKGGRTGKQRGNGPLTKIKIILVEGNKVITAYPY